MNPFKRVFLTAVLCLIAVGSVASAPIFNAHIDYQLGTGPTGVAVADFDGDGKLDVVVTNYDFRVPDQAGTIAVLRNNGDGTLAPAVVYGVGKWPFSVTVADFDGDGKADIAVPNYGAYSVSILKNNGDGTFAAAVNYTVAGTPMSVTAADFNGDGKLDLAVAINSNTCISILKNKGDGSFETYTIWGVMGGPSAIAAADLDGDGVVDLAIAKEQSNLVSILKGNGLGGFVNGGNYAVDTMPMSVIVADFDGDGKLDLAVGCDGGYTPDQGYVSVLKNNGDGTFASAINYQTGLAASLTAGDFNGDGKLDLAAAIDHSTLIAVLRNYGDGTFSPRVYYAAAAGPKGVAAADLDGDGRVDLAVAAGEGEAASILINQGCCRGKTGDVNQIGIVDLGDLSYLVSYLTGGGVNIACPAAANVNGVGTIDLADLRSLVNYLTGGGYTRPNCP
jgi:hypothetical protein